MGPVVKRAMADPYRDAPSHEQLLEELKSLLIMNASGRTPGERAQMIQRIGELKRTIPQEMLDRAGVGDVAVGMRGLFGL
jgi:hypothetical protein